MKTHTDPTIALQSLSALEERMITTAPVSPPIRTARGALVDLYIHCREAVFQAGFGEEVEYYSTRNLAAISESEFLCELGWVIVNSGMRNIVCRSLWPQLRAVFLEFADLPAILERRIEIRPAALAILSHPGKIDAIFRAVERVTASSWPAIRTEIEREGITALRRFPYIGPIICYHLAKNIGLQVAKPDRHLLRIATAAGYGTDVQALCENLATATGDPIPVVDYIIWRCAATLDPHYLTRFTQMQP
ncbi:MAG: hypothetical protein ACHQ7N_18115 [Candidatus Methylomirabilales bacterium]